MPTPSAATPVYDPTIAAPTLTAPFPPGTKEATTLSASSARTPLLFHNALPTQFSVDRARFSNVSSFGLMDLAGSRRLLLSNALPPPRPAPPVSLGHTIYKGPFGSLG